MFYNFGRVLRDRLIRELEHGFSAHPIFSKIAIQSKFAFSSRPHFAIVVKSNGGSKLALSSDNYLGQLQSHVMLSYVGQPCFPLEWVREDSNALQENNGILLSLPGVYYIDIITAPNEIGDLGYFTLTPSFTITNEDVVTYRVGMTSEGQLLQVPRPNTLRLYQNGQSKLVEGVDFNVSTSSTVTFPRTFPNGTRITADYRYAGAASEQIPFMWNTSNHKSLPGVILAFGRRARAGDRVAVVVYPQRTQTAEVHGGRFDFNFDLEVITTDVDQTAEVAELAVSTLLERRALLGAQGIEVGDFSFGGESEEMYDETAKKYLFSSTVAISLQSDWEVHSPLPLVISGYSEQVRPANRFEIVSYPLLGGQVPNFERLI